MSKEYIEKEKVQLYANNLRQYLNELYNDGWLTITDIDWRVLMSLILTVNDIPPVEQPKAKNIGADYGEQDQFMCSECGIHLQDWVRIDEDDYEDGVVHEYVFRFCPNCGRRIDDER